LQNDISKAYKNVKSNAQRDLLEQETKHGFAEPVIPENCAIVQCNRYSGGFDICAALSLSCVVEQFPGNLDKIFQECFEIDIEKSSPDDLSQYQLTRLKEKNALRAQTIWNTWVDIQSCDNFRHKCLVLLKTRFSPTKHNWDSFKQNTQTSYRHFLGHILYKFSQTVRLVPSDCIVCGSSFNDHTRIIHKSKASPAIRHGCGGGFSCRVYIPLIL